MAPRVSFLFKRDAPAAAPPLVERSTTEETPKLPERTPFDISSTLSPSGVPAEGPHIFKNKSYHPSHGRTTPYVVVPGRAKLNDKVLRCVCYTN